MSVEIALIGYFLSAWLIHCSAITPSFLASADNSRGLETFQPPRPGADMCPIWSFNPLGCCNEAKMY
jgi:hypothetical protein